MRKISWNAPVVLGFALISGIALVVNQLTGGLANRLLFSVYRGSLRDPLFYVRLFGHVLGHADLSHYTGNMLLFLLLGPMMEEKYGSKNLLSVILLTALVTAGVHLFLGGNTALEGASGVVFALIMLSSVTGSSKGIPLTMILVAVVYIGQQVYQGIFIHDQISQLTHIAGGIVGMMCGLAMRR